MEVNVAAWTIGGPVVSQVNLYEWKKDADRSKAVVSNDVQQEVPVFDHFLFIFLKILILLNLSCPYLKGLFF